MTVKDLLDIPPWKWPDDAGKVCLKTLVNRQADASDRLIAAELGGEIVAMDDGLAAALLAIVGHRDESEALRGTAAIALGPVLELAFTELDEEEFDDPDAVPIGLDTFRSIQDSLRTLYLDESNPKEVRRRILEAAVRAPQDWQTHAVKVAYASGDLDWRLTAVFAMGHVRGFDEQIMESLASPDPQIHCEAVRAAGNWQLDAAWPHVVVLVEDPSTPKPLLLAAIEAVGYIRPKEAGAVLVDLGDSGDEDIANAADEAMGLAREMSEEDEEEPEDAEDGDWIN